MIPPKKPANEAERLATLYQLHILDTEREERFDRVTRVACKLFNVPIAVLSFMEAERQWMKSTQGFDIKEAARKTSFCGHSLVTEGLFIIEDASVDERFYDNPFVIGEPNIRFYLGSSIKIHGYSVGTLCLIDDKPRSIAEIDQEVFTDLTKMVEVELETLHLSTADELTGLSNRRGFLKIAEHLFQMCRDENKTFNLLFFDLDKFKQINDTLGHAEGDKVLKRFSSALQQYFRHSDVIARLGGDEFCAFCPDMDAKYVDSIAKRLRSHLQADSAEGCNILFSYGSIQFDPQKYHNLQEMLTQADEKMYQDKKNGR